MLMPFRGCRAFWRRRAPPGHCGRQAVSILEGANVVRRVQESLGERCASLSPGGAPHSPVSTLEEAVRLAEEARPTCW